MIKAGRLPADVVSARAVDRAAPPADVAPKSILGSAKLPKETAQRVARFRAQRAETEGVQSTPRTLKDHSSRAKYERERRLRDASIQKKLAFDEQ